MASQPFICLTCSRVASVSESCARPICVHAWDGNSPEIWDGDDCGADGDRKIEESPNESWRVPGPDTWAQMIEWSTSPYVGVETRREALVADRPTHLDKSVREPSWRHKMGPDDWYQMLDPGIRFAVRVLHAHGIETGQSCEGGDGHAYDWPTVDLWGTGNGATGLAAVHYLHEYGLPVRDVAKLWRVEDGLPVEMFWRITFSKPFRERAEEKPMFVWGCQTRENK